jgi:K+-transporting ATPase ATPase C chain
MNRLRGAWRHYRVALRTMIVLTLALGAGYTLAVTAIAQLAFPQQANGSMIARDGTTVGSALIGQSFTDRNGRPIATWFQSRPSSAGSGYDGSSSSGSNLAASNPAQRKAVEERTAAISAIEHVAPSAVPDNAVTASGSGLDAHISPAYALLQVARVASARGLPEPTVRSLVLSKIQGRDLGYLGEPTVDVVQLNLALAEMDK